MPHERQTIREAIVDALTGETSAGARVFETRMGPARVAELPAVCVYSEAEVSKRTGPNEVERVAQVSVEGWAIATSDVEDALDDLALEIETAMDADPHLAGNVFDAVLVGTETGIKLDGERPMGAVVLTYEITYHTQNRTAEPVDKFDVAATKHDLAGNQAEEDQASDLVEDIHE